MKYVKVWAVDSSGVCKCGKGTDCPRPGKHPVGATWDAVDLEEFELDSAYNWGLVTGEVNGIFVVDCDVHGEVNGILAVGELGTLPTTHTVRTGSGGLHYYFKWPGTAIANSAAKLAPGVDIRGDGGYVLVPPSVNSKGPYTLVSNAPIAAAPAWLLERLSRPQAEETTQTVSLGEATPDDIAAARAEVLMMPRAISGQGGDDLTFRVAAVLANDYGLSEEEGFPIFAEWNARCEPPWGPAELKLKWRGGLKYATGRYGSKRTGGLRSAVKTLLDNWSSNNLGEAGLPALVKGLERAAREHPITDRTVLDALCAQVTKVTGLPAGKTGLKNAVPLEPTDDGPAGRIEMHLRPGQIDALSTEAETALVNSDIYRRSDKVVVLAAGRLSTPDVSYVQRLLNRVLYVTKYDARKNSDVVTNPPMDLAKNVLTNKNCPFREVVGVLPCPSIRYDGTIINARGVDQETGLLMYEPMNLGAIGETREEALAAIERLEGLLVNFPFRDIGLGCAPIESLDRAVALSMMLTPVCHAAYKTSPGHGSNAVTPGTGKSYLVDTCTSIATGLPEADTTDIGHDAAEFEKRLNAAIRGGQLVIALDNIEAPLGGKLLCQMVERYSVQIRNFSTLDLETYRKRVMFTAGGQNLTIMADSTRRWVLTNLYCDEDRPQDRQFPWKPTDRVLSNRGQYLRDCLTVARAAVVQKCPRVQRLASFEAWSDIVPSALVWLGRRNPIESQKEICSKDPVQTELTEAHTGIRRLNLGFSRAKDIVNAAGDADWLVGIAGDPPSPKKLAAWLKHHEGRPLAGYTIASKKDQHLNTTVFNVVPRR